MYPIVSTVAINFSGLYVSALHSRKIDATQNAIEVP